MKHLRTTSCLVTLVLVAAGGGAIAQPLPPEAIPEPPSPPADPDPPVEDPAQPDEDLRAAEEPARPAEPPPTDPDVATAPPVPAPGNLAAAVASTVPPKLEMHFPNILRAPSGHLLPAAMIWSTTGVHTGGSVYSDMHVGLGDVAEFGLSVTDLIRVKGGPDAEPEAVTPFVEASFKMGVGEHRLVRHQPAIALAFRKSFEHHQHGATIRTAGLFLVASKSIGSRLTLHGGGVMWDASLGETDGSTFYLHDGGLNDQLRPFGAIEVEPLPRSQIMVELSWVPELARNPSTAKLSALLAWGVRYRITTLFAFESGVRIQGIEDADLLEAQIFGQLSWGTDRVRRAIASLR